MLALWTSVSHFTHQFLVAAIVLGMHGQLLGAFRADAVSLAEHQLSVHRPIEPSPVAISQSTKWAIFDKREDPTDPKSKCMYRFRLPFAGRACATNTVSDFWDTCSDGITTKYNMGRCSNGRWCDNLADRDADGYTHIVCRDSRSSSYYEVGAAADGQDSDGDSEQDSEGSSSGTNPDHCTATYSQENAPNGGRGRGRNTNFAPVYTCYQSLAMDDIHKTIRIPATLQLPEGPFRIDAYMQVRGTSQLDTTSDGLTGSLEGTKGEVCGLTTNPVAQALAKWRPGSGRCESASVVELRQGDLLNFDLKHRIVDTAKLVLVVHLISAASMWQQPRLTVGRGV